MNLLSIVFAFAVNAHAIGFIPADVLCQTDHPKLLAEAGEHTFKFKEPYARKSEIGYFFSFEQPDPEAGETAYHALFVPGNEPVTNYKRLAIPDPGFERCLHLINGPVRVGYIQMKENGPMKLVFVSSGAESAGAVTVPSVKSK